MAASSEFPPASIKPLAAEVASLLMQRKETVSVAETAAGGIVSAALLSVPGASKIYKGGLTLYTLESRIAFAGWTQADIKAYAGPTPQLVAGLATHVRDSLGSTYTLAESGTAGPTRPGEGRNRTPGYVALAVNSDKAGSVTREIETGSENREENMILFAKGALELLRDVIKGEAGKL